MESLLNAIPPEGAIIAYSNYEQTVMKHLATEFPEFEDGLLALCERTFDLLKLVREEYYHPQSHGSFSIKSVLPTPILDLGYGGLEIQHGLIAAIDFGRMVAEDTPVAEKNSTRDALRAYWKRDTEAMVRVFDVLCSMDPQVTPSVLEAPYPRATT